MENYFCFSPPIGKFLFNVTSKALTHNINWYLSTYTSLCFYFNIKCIIKRVNNKRRYIPVNVLASSLSILVPSLVDTQVKCRGSTSRSPVRDVKLPSAAVQLLTFPFPVKETSFMLCKSIFKRQELYGKL